MEFLFHALATCRSGLADFVMSPLGLPAGLFLAGLGGSVLHCAGMCGPFVLGQVMADAGVATAARYGEWRRLSGAALLPYHLGRATTYTLLGTVAGAVTGLFATTAIFGWLAGGLLLLAALLMLTQALGLATGGANAPFAAGLTRLASPLAAARGPAARYALGVVLGFLPCGLLYGALAAAGGSGTAAIGALSMAAFAAGTMPALIVVGWLGAIARQRLSGTARWLAVPLLLANALLMTMLAIERL